MHHHELPELVNPNWNVRGDLLISDDDFLRKGTRLVIFASLCKYVQADLQASHGSIGGTKARARLIVYWSEIDNDITSTCKSCSKGGFDRPSNEEEPVQHLPVAEHAFHIISGDWFDLNGEKFLVVADWFSRHFYVKDPVSFLTLPRLISCLREWFITTAVCDVL